MPPRVAPCAPPRAECAVQREPSLQPTRPPPRRLRAQTWAGAGAFYFRAESCRHVFSKYWCEDPVLNE